MHPSLPRIVTLLLTLLSATFSYAQCTFTSRSGGGNWSNPLTWTRSGTGCGTALIPTVNARVVISSRVILDQNVSVEQGTITINPNGSLEEDGTARTLSLGTGSGNAAERLAANGYLAVSNLQLTKANAVVNTPITIKCNLTQANQATLTISSLVTVLGSYNLVNGNVVADGNGYLYIKGCVTGSNGAINTSVQGNLRVCVESPNMARGCGNTNCNGNRPINNTNNCAIIVALPVKLIYFKAKHLADNRVLLQWATASEDNNSLFTVESSRDGSAFSAVASVAGAGNSFTNRVYSLYDNNPPPGLAYYRLKQTDADGSYSYSAVIAVQSDQLAAEDKVVVVVHPGADETGKLDVRFGPALDRATIQVLNLMGREVFYGNYRAGNSTGVQSVDLSQQQKGVYIVRITAPNYAYSTKVVLR